jgi:TonB family protein
MSLGQVNNALNLLGQGAATAARMAPIRPSSPTSAPDRPAIRVEPKLGIAWGDFHQGFFSGVRSLFTGPFRVGQFLGGDYFRDCWVERRAPKRAVVAAALWHIFFIISPFSLLSTTLRHNPAFDHTQLTWSGPIEDFPLLDIRAAKPKVVARDVAKPVVPKSAEAFHPRQRIVTDPVHPNHPRQTLINPAAPKLAPRVAPALPNIVQLQAPVAPARPPLEISADALAKLHPRAQHKRVATATAPPPEFAALDAKPGAIQLAPAANSPARPKLDLNASAAPRLADRTRGGDTVAAPELAAQAGTESPSTLIALSAAPAPPKPDVQPPAGNLAARVSMSPEGKKSADPTAGASANASTGKSDIGVSISGGNPQPKTNASALSGAPRPNLNLPSAHALMTHTQPKNADAPETGEPPNFSILPPGAKPEEIFASKRVYTLAVNMANINSASGSWILHFAEMGSGSAAAYGSGTAATPSAPADLALPVPVRKVDPKYPPDLIEQNVQGEVVLYAVVRADGSVGGIQVARSLDPQLDANAKAAFAQWKFTPASKAGNAVEVQVIAHIPFKISDDR